jgi:hypothetical protein
VDGMIIIVWVTGTVGVAVLAIANCCPFTVTAGLALLILVLSMGRELLRARRACRAVRVREAARATRARVLAGWTERDEVILGGDLSPAAWEQAGQLRQGDAR